MTHRERLRAAIERQQTDRVPIDFGGHRSSGISAIAYAKLKKALGITSGAVYVHDMIQQLAVVEEETADILGADVTELGRAFSAREEDWKDWVLPDGTPCKIPVFINIEKRGENWVLLSETGRELAVQRPGMLYFEQTYWPWLDADPREQDFSDIEEALSESMWTAVPIPGGNIPLSGTGAAKLRSGAQELRERSSRAVMGLFGGSFFEIPQFLYRIDNYLSYMALYPDACKRLSEALCNFHLKRLETWLGAVGPFIDVILFGDDLGGQNGPLISPAMYREIIKPYHSRLFKTVKERAPGVLVHLHSCGDIEPLLEDLIDAGLQSANPVQISCPGMQPPLLKEKYGGRFVFWGGGCDTRSVLPKGSPKEIKRHVTENLSVWEPGGGYVFQQVHNILSDVPPENIIAMFEAVREFRL